MGTIDKEVPENYSIPEQSFKSPASESIYNDEEVSYTEYPMASPHARAKNKV